MNQQPTLKLSAINHALDGANDPAAGLPAVKPSETKSYKHKSTLPNIPEIVHDDKAYLPAGKLNGLVAIVTGGDSGIGRATAIAFAKEGADVAIVYNIEDGDAAQTVDAIKQYGRKAVAVKGNLGSRDFCQVVVRQAIAAFGRLDILVNNAGTQKPQEQLTDITEAQLELTFRTNIYSMFFMTQAALPQLREGSCIINTTSVTSYRGSAELLDYSSTKGAITAFTRSLALNLAPRQIRVNAVAPGPVWTPLVIDSFDEEKLASFGKEQPLGRAGQPSEIAPAFVYLASNDASYMTGQVLHVNGGEIVNA